MAGNFLANIVPGGTFGQLLSAGTVPILNGAVGLEVGCGIVVLVAHFLQQDIIISAQAEQAKPGGSSEPQAGERVGTAERS